MREPCEYMGKKTLDLWDRYSCRFKNENSLNGYFGDINQFMEYVQKDFLDITQGDADKFHNFLLNEIRNKKIVVSTMEKKIKILHNFSDFIIKQHNLPVDFKDYFYVHAAKSFATKELKDVPTLDTIDRLLDAAKRHIMYYTIITLVQRVGLRSTQIIDLRMQDIVVDKNGAYLVVKDNIKYIPEDAWKILEQYLAHRMDSDVEFVFYNRWDRKLNVEYLSNMMRKLCDIAGLPRVSMNDIKNTCGVLLFAYDAEPYQVAKQLGIGMRNIRRYNDIHYRDNMSKNIADLVNLKVIPPEIN